MNRKIEKTDLTLPPDLLVSICIIVSVLLLRQGISFRWRRG